MRLNRVVALLSLLACSFVGAAPAHADKDVPPAAPALPDFELSDQVLFELLLGEVAGQRGDLELSANTYLTLAQNTRDARLAQRATEIALYGRLQNQALQAASLWVELDPNALQARQALAATLVSMGRLLEAQPHLEKLIAALGPDPGKGFLHLNAAMIRQADAKNVLELMKNLAKSYPKVAEAHFTLAQAALNAGQLELALAEAREVGRLQAGWEAAALLEGRILQRTSVDQELSFYQEFLGSHPETREVRLAYARALVAAKRFDLARPQFVRLMADYPANPDVPVALGLLSIQLEDYDTAESYLKKALNLGYTNPDMVRMYLGQLEERRKQWDEADRWYQSVGPGENFLSAQIKRAEIMAKQGKLDEARAFLRQISIQGSQQQIQLVLAEAQLLRNAKAYQQAYDLLGRALQKQPEAPELLYDFAMAAERLNRIDVVESNLRKLIEIQPNYAHAYNALGYTLADRTDRLAEARGLIEKALSLSPDDAYILDSMGWVQFRLGQLVEAEANLRRAYTLQADPEIAAHLGEVLWTQGRNVEARDLWRASLQINPESEALLNVMKRFQAMTH